MNDWIDFVALGKIVGVGLLCGAGLPAIFALGLKALTIGAPSTVPAGAGRQANVGGTSEVGGREPTGSPVGYALAGLCFAIVLAAIAWGIYIIVAGK